MSFKSLGLDQNLLKAIEAKGYDTPSPIQAESIPVILADKDLLAAAQTGTGKTAAFVLPILQKLIEAGPADAKAKAKVKVLILTPTRELAAQVEKSVMDYGQFLKFKTSVVFGGVKIYPQISRLKKGVDIVVATPGRLLDLCSQKAIKLSQVDMFVMDEADRMLDMGFIHDIKKIIKLLPAKRQNLLFSATFSKDVRKLVEEILVDPISIQVSAQNSTAEKVNQYAYKIEKSRKHNLLKYLIDKGQWEQVLVFSRTRHGADRLSKRLGEMKIKSKAIHGDKSQAIRTKTLQEFKEGKVQVLVATDIAARGLDIKELPCVVNFDMPAVAEDYVHRIGRTARAGSEGLALSLVSHDELKALKKIEQLIKQDLPLGVAPGFDKVKFCKIKRSEKNSPPRQPRRSFKKDKKKQRTR